MFDMIFEMFSYNFIVRAFIVGTLVSLCAALLGVTLVLKRYSMIGDGLSLKILLQRRCSFLHVTMSQRMILKTAQLIFLLWNKILKH